jgi:hypothetical protein
MIVLIGIVVAAIYCALFYAAPGPAKNLAEPPPPSASKAKVLGNFALGVLFFLLVDGAIFHSGLYTVILKPESHAGALFGRVREEYRRQTRSANKEILVIGDSRVVTDFNWQLANELASGKDVAFFSRAMGGSTAKIWHYFLREVDPGRNRYRIIVIPLKPDDATLSARAPGGADRPSEIAQLAPLLRYSDALSFPASFHEWRNQVRAFIACILRGAVYQRDLFDLLENPRARFRDLQSNVTWEARQLVRPPRDVDLAGLEFDPLTGRIEKFPNGLTKRRQLQLQREARNIRRRSFAGDGSDYTWSKRIVDRYASGPTTVVFARLPRGPLGAFLARHRVPGKTADEIWLSQHAVVLDYRTFDFLEAPDYYIDYVHLNEKGRRLFTKRLTEELLMHLQTKSATKAQASSAAGFSR